MGKVLRSFRKFFGTGSNQSSKKSTNDKDEKIALDNEVIPEKEESCETGYVASGLTPVTDGGKEPDSSTKGMDVKSGVKQPGRKSRVRKFFGIASNESNNMTKNSTNDKIAQDYKVESEKDPSDNTAGCSKSGVTPVTEGEEGQPELLTKEMDINDEAKNPRKKSRFRRFFEITDFRDFVDHIMPHFEIELGQYYQRRKAAFSNIIDLFAAQWTRLSEFREGYLFSLPHYQLLVKSKRDLFRQLEPMNDRRLTEEISMWFGKGNDIVNSLFYTRKYLMSTQQSGVRIGPLN